MQRFYFLFETVIGLACLIVINVSFFSENPAFIDTNPHPYWLIIFLVAGRYGPAQGLITGILTAGVYTFWGFTEGGLIFKKFAWLNSDFILPVAFVVIGLCSGWINYMFARRKARQQNVTQKNYRETLTTELELSTDKNPVRLSTANLSAAYNALLAMRSLPITEFCKKIPDLLRLVIGATSVSVYLVRNNRLQLQYRDNHSGKDSVLPDSVTLEKGPMAQVIIDRKPLIFEGAGGVEMSAPMLCGDEIIGVINVEGLAKGIDCDHNTINVFEMLTDWITSSLEHLKRSDEHHDNAVTDEPPNVHSYEFFKKSLQHEISRARRSNLPVALLLMEVDKFAEMSEAERENVVTVLVRIFADTLRAVDIISSYNKENIFAIILPGQSKTDVDYIKERLLQDVNSYKLRPFEKRMEYLSLKTGTAVCEPRKGSYEHLILEAESQLQGEEIKIVHDLFDDIEYLQRKYECTIQGK